MKNQEQYTPLLSVVIPTRNSSALLGQCLGSITRQTYKNVEIVIADGASTDETLKIAKKYKAIIYNNPDILAEPGITLGMKKAKGDLIMILAVDNEFKNNHALETIVAVFKDKTIFAAFPKHESDTSDSIFSKYINTFTDPFNHFVYANAANARTFKKEYKALETTSTYEVFDFLSSKVRPILALAQGFTIRKSFAQQRKDSFDDISPVIKLIEEKKKIAYVYGVNLYHHTIRNADHFFRKQRWATKNALAKKDYGIAKRVSKLTYTQKVKMYVYPFYSISILLPLVYSVYKAIIDQEKIWLFHMPITLLSTIAILYETSIIKLGLNPQVSRQ